MRQRALVVLGILALLALGRCSAPGVPDSGWCYDRYDPEAHASPAACERVYERGWIESERF